MSAAPHITKSKAKTVPKQPCRQWGSKTIMIPYLLLSKLPPCRITFAHRGCASVLGRLYLCILDLVGRIGFVQLGLQRFDLIPAAAHSSSPCARGNSRGGGGPTHQAALRQCHVDMCVRIRVHALIMRISPLALTFASRCPPPPGIPPPRLLPPPPLGGRLLGDEDRMGGVGDDALLPCMNGTGLRERVRPPTGLPLASS